MRYLRTARTVKDQVIIFALSPDLRLVTSQPYVRLSPSSKSMANVRSLVLLVSALCRRQEEKEACVMHSPVSVLTEAMMVSLESYRIMEDTVVSESRDVTEHSTCCILGRL